MLLGWVYIFELLLEFIKLLGVDQACLVIDILRDVETAILFVDFADDGFDGWIALDQGTLGNGIKFWTFGSQQEVGAYRPSHEACCMS